MIGDNPINLPLIYQYARLSDNDISNIAYKHASYSVNDKKHKKIDNALWYSIPVAAGLSWAADKAPRIGRVKNFAKGTANWLLPFVALDAALLLKRGMEKYSQTVRDFTDNHPVVSAFAGLGAALAMFYAGTGSAYKLYNMNKAKLSPLVTKLSGKLESSKLLDKASEMMKKVPSSVKDVSKTILGLSPLALFVARAVHFINHDRVKAAEYGYNYNDLKTKQQIAQEVLKGVQV